MLSMTSKMVLILFFLLTGFRLVRSEKLIDLNQNSFASTVGGNEALLLFYAPWCPHCNNFKPTWQDFAKQYNSSLVIGNVDCTVEGYLCREFAIAGYPTVYFVKDGKKYTFQGQRTIEGLTKFINEEYKNAPSSGIPKWLEDYKPTAEEKPKVENKTKVEEKSKTVERPKVENKSIVESKKKPQTEEKPKTEKRPKIEEIPKVQEKSKMEDLKILNKTNTTTEAMLQQLKAQVGTEQGKSSQSQSRTSVITVILVTIGSALLFLALFCKFVREDLGKPHLKNREISKEEEDIEDEEEEDEETGHKEDYIKGNSVVNVE